MSDKCNDIEDTALASEQNYNIIDGVHNNAPLTVPQRGQLRKKRKRDIHLHVMVTPEELELIRGRMTEAGITNAGAYMRKMALNGFVLHVDLSPVRELVSLQRKCSNNLNQIAVSVNTYGGIYPKEIAALQHDYAALWGPLSDLIKRLAEVVEL